MLKAFKSDSQHFDVMMTPTLYSSVDYTLYRCFEEFFVTKLNIFY